MKATVLDTPKDMAERHPLFPGTGKARWRLGGGVRVI